MRWSASGAPPSSTPCCPSSSSSASPSSSSLRVGVMIVLACCLFRICVALLSTGGSCGASQLPRRLCLLHRWVWLRLFGGIVTSWGQLRHLLQSKAASPSSMFNCSVIVFSPTEPTELATRLEMIVALFLALTGKARWNATGHAAGENATGQLEDGNRAR